MTGGLALAALLGVVLTTRAQQRLKLEVTPRPKLTPVAETRLLMDGLAQANFRGLEKLLADKPEGAEAWTFARGQALLIAETGNLLLLRPPRRQGQKEWGDRAVRLRTAATRLARDLANRDLEKGRKGLVALSRVCNSCHQTFRVRTRIRPFEGTTARREVSHADPGRR
jgi:hypothetical protein